MKNILTLIIFIYISFNFLGCSSTEADIPQKVNVLDNNQSMQNDENGEFSDFEDEVDLIEVYDPFISYNRSMTNFNDNLYINVLKPMDKVYKVLTTQDIRNSIGNFFNNIYFPMHFLNNLLQAKVNGMLVESGRFLINSTIGVFGLFDPAKNKFGLYPHREDFGQTLGSYGVGAGPHIVIPFFGPSNLRDLFSVLPDAIVSPIDYTDRPWWTITSTYWGLLGVKSLEEFNNVSMYTIQYDQIRKDAVDLYPYLRDIYEQKREDDIGR